MSAPYPRNCFVAGANRSVGFEVAKGLVQQSYQVAVLLRADGPRSQQCI